MRGHGSGVEMADPRILTCSVTGGGTTRAQNPNLPVTPEEIASSCIEAAEAGAAMCHIHVRNPATGGMSTELKHYQEVVERIRASGSDMVINLTTGPGCFYDPSDDDPAVPGPGTMIYTAQRRVEHVLALKPDVCSLDIGSMNFNNEVVVNIPKIVREMIPLMKQAGTKPEIEIFDTGDVVFAKDLIAEGLLEGPHLFQFVMGGKYGAASSPELLYYLRNSLPANSVWGGFGIGRTAFQMVATIFMAGGHSRIGMEDTVYLSRGVLAKSNAELITKARRIIEDLGGEIATPAQAREILQIERR